jgi:ribosomal protein S18 acetylase RimI-like enzyme
MFQNITSDNGTTQIKNALKADYEQVAKFLNQNIQIHRHLDWFSALHWLGRSTYLLEIRNNEISALLCAVPENESIAWLRVFAVQFHQNIQNSWLQLLKAAKYQLIEMDIHQIVTLSLHPWFEKLINKSGFQNRQNISVLEWQGKLPEKQSINQDVIVRSMRAGDLNQVAGIDHQSFPPIWQNSIDGLEKAFNQTGICTVACANDQIVGYQISTTSSISGHLARLAVLPAYQKQGIAFTLVYDLLQKFKIQGLWRVTVNTQSDNQNSLHLYGKFGFKRTAEEIPVYSLNLSN